MGCDCDCHEKLNKIGVLGCCFKCEAEHDPLRNALLQVGEQTQDIEFYRALILRVYCTHKPEVQDTNCNRCQMTWRDNLRAQGNLYLRPALKPVDVKARLALIENGKCPECGEKAHLHNCTEKQKDVIDNGPSGITDTISFSAKPVDQPPLLCPHGAIHEIGWGICSRCADSGTPRAPERKPVTEKREGQSPKKCDHGEILVLHKCADCGEKIEFV